MTNGYNNTETKIKGGMKTVRNVSIKKGRGYKQITKYQRGKKISHVKMPISPEHVQKIQAGTFVSGLFDDCKSCKNKTRKLR